MTPPEIVVADGVLSKVRVRGDFAPEPILDAIAAALTGAPADATVPALAARVRAAVPFDRDLTGATPFTIAEAVRHVVGGETTERIGSLTPAEIDRLTAGWKLFPWRLVPERPLPPALNVALDEAVAERVAAGTSPPTLRFWQWDASAVVLGRTQSVANEVDLAAATAMGVQVVRRSTGGGAMFVQPHGAITYSLVLPESAVAGLSIRRSYEVCDAWVVLALRALGIDAHHVPVNDLACGDGKLGGAAQARRKGVVLHHTTLAHALDGGEMAAVIRLGREKVHARGTASASKRVSPLARQTSLSRAAVSAHLFARFRAAFGGEPGEPSPEEWADADRLVGEKYGSPGWTHEFA